MPYYAAPFRAVTPPPMESKLAPSGGVHLSAAEPEPALMPLTPPVVAKETDVPLTASMSWLPSPSYTVDIMHVVMLLAVIILSIVVAGLGAKLSMLEMMLTAVLQNEAARR
jgi:hypothetical protein